MQNLRANSGALNIVSAKPVTRICQVMVVCKRKRGCRFLRQPRFSYFICVDLFLCNFGCYDVGQDKRACGNHRIVVCYTELDRDACFSCGLGICHTVLKIRLFFATLKFLFKDYYSFLAVKKRYVCKIFQQKG